MCEVELLLFCCFSAVCVRCVVMFMSVICNLFMCLSIFLFVLLVLCVILFVNCLLNSCAFCLFVNAVLLLKVIVQLCCGFGFFVVQSCYCVPQFMCVCFMVPSVL